MRGLTPNSQNVENWLRFLKAILCDQTILVPNNE